MSFFELYLRVLEGSELLESSKDGVSHKIDSPLSDEEKTL